MPGSRSAPDSKDGYFESYKSEIAAYELDKLLGLNMVPVVVERRVNNDDGAAVMWIEGVRSWETVLPLPKPATWGFQLARMKMFDDLISNSDRNKGNLLVDADWHIFLIDHSRAFVTDMKLPAGTAEHRPPAVGPDAGARRGGAEDDDGRRGSTAVRSSRSSAGGTR